MFQLIKSLQEKGLGYRKISQYLNEKGFTTHKGNKWGNNNVYSVVKRHRERVNRLRVKKKIYQPNWGKMKVIWERNQDQVFELILIALFVKDSLFKIL